MLDVMSKASAAPWMRKVAAGSLLLVSCVTTAQAASMLAATGSKSDTIASAAQAAIESNPEVQARWHAFLASGEDRDEVHGAYLPSIDLTASAGKANRDFDGRSNYGRGQAEVTLTQMLFDGFRVSNQLARADHTRMTRYYELMDAVQGKALEVAQAYEDVTRYREMVELAKHNYSNHERVFKQINARAKSGVGNKADLEQIRGRRSLAEVNLLTEAANLHDASARFVRLVGRAPYSDMTATVLEGNDVIPANLQQVLRLAYAGNPGFHAAFEGVNSARAAVDERKASRYPRLELRARYGLSKNMNGFDARTDPDNLGKESVVELGLGYNIFRGGSDLAAERAANLRANQAEDLRLKACIDLRQTTSIAWNDYYNLREKLSSLKSHRDGSASVVKAYRDQFDIGRRSLLDVLDSENEAFQAERAYANGHFDQKVSYYRTLNSMGRLLPALGVAREGLPTVEDLGGEAIGAKAGDICSATDHAAPSLTAMRLASNVQFDQENPPREVMNLAGDALFASGSATISPAASAYLTGLLSKVKSTHNVRRIVITGHTDSVGSSAANKSLSIARAIAVRNYLVDSGVSSALILSKGASSNEPVADNATAEGRASNRRVEVAIETAI